MITATKEKTSRRMAIDKQALVFKCKNTQTTQQNEF